jgi:hypothetical protein
VVVAVGRVHPKNTTNNRRILMDEKKVKSVLAYWWSQSDGGWPKEVLLKMAELRWPDCSFRTDDDDDMGNMDHVVCVASPREKDLGKTAAELDAEEHQFIPRGPYIRRKPIAQ